MKKLFILSILISLSVIVAACGNDEEETGNPEAPVDEQVDISEDERVSPDTLVATVNGDEIKGDRYNPIYTQVKMQMAQFGEDASDLDLLREQTLNVLVEQQLISQDAEMVGIEVTEDEVENEFNELKEQNEEQLSIVLEEFNLTEEEFKTQLRDDLITEEYINSELDIEVSDEEVEEFYEQMREENEDIEELDELEALIRAQLENQKTQEQLPVKLEELRENADIEHMI
ncbi:SurA N-terminal domain-containing protein [Virgibacillus kimchii]